MEKQWGDNPEYTFYLWCDLTNWALPFSLGWQHQEYVKGSKRFAIVFRLLCINVEIEIWRWK